MRCLVTGATGFVGGAVVRRLLERGDGVQCLVRDGSDGAGELRELGAEVFSGSLADPNEIRVAAAGAEVVVHAAAEASDRSASRVLRWVNVAGTENVINAVRSAGCHRLVYVSCADVTLSDEDRVHWNEDRMVSEPLDAHARSKQLAEELVMAASDPELDTVSLRPAILWGPGDRHTLPGLLTRGGGQLRQVSNGRNLLSTTYIDHLVDAVLAAVASDAAVGRAYYVTDPYFIEAREFLAALASAIGVQAPRSGGPYSVAWVGANVNRALGRGASAQWPSDVVRWGRATQFDTSAATRDLDLSPEVTLEDGMARVGEWVARRGGPAAVRDSLPTPAIDSAVDGQVAAAGGD